MPPRMSYWRADGCYLVLEGNIVNSNLNAGVFNPLLFWRRVNINSKMDDSPHLFQAPEGEFVANALTAVHFKLSNVPIDFDKKG